MQRRMPMRFGDIPDGTVLVLGKKTGFLFVKIEEVTRADGKRANLVSINGKRPGALYWIHEGFKGLCPETKQSS